MAVGGAVSLLDVPLYEQGHLVYSGVEYSGSLAQRSGCFYYYDNQFRHILNQGFHGVDLAEKCGANGEAIPQMCRFGAVKVRVNTVVTGALKALHGLLSRRHALLSIIFAV